MSLLRQALLAGGGASAMPAIARSPFSNQSLWNARPTGLVLDNSRSIPNSYYDPLIAAGQYSVTGYVASAVHPLVNVYGLAGPGSGSLVDMDGEVTVECVTIRMPPGALPAIGSDGHMDIINVVENRIDSFWEAQVDSNGVYRANTYAWMPLNGLGFSNPGQYHQGARAAGVPPIAGIIRNFEIHDGAAMYAHALCMSMTYNGIAPSPLFVFPATATDSDAASTDTGAIHYGERLFIPSSFDPTTMPTAQLQKIVRTLQTYGAYLVDRNVGCPYALYIENGNVPFDIYEGTYFNPTIHSAILAIQAALRPMASVAGWLDRNGNAFTPTQWLNLLSMRGYWYPLQGSAPTFNTLLQQAVFPNNGTFSKAEAVTGRSAPFNSYCQPVAGQTYQFTVATTGGAQLQLQVAGSSTVYYDTGMQVNGAVVNFTWPANGNIVWIVAQSGPSGGGSVGGTLIRQT